MKNDDVPADVREFLLRHIDSVTQLEILLLLGSNPERDWNAETASRHLFNNALAVQEQLGHLHERGLLSAFPGPSRTHYRYRGGADGGALLRALADAYRLKPARVIEIIVLREAPRAPLAD